MTDIALARPIKIAHVVEEFEEKGAQGHEINEASACCACAPRVECLLDDAKTLVLGFIVIHQKYGPN